MYWIRFFPVIIVKNVQHQLLLLKNFGYFSLYLSFVFRICFWCFFVETPFRCCSVHAAESCRYKKRIWMPRRKRLLSLLATNSMEGKFLGVFYLFYGPWTVIRPLSIFSFGKLAIQLLSTEAVIRRCSVGFLKVL